mgnify:CR=1 FL=1
MIDGVEAILFDTYGTVVDWRNSVAGEGEALAQAKGIEGLDWAAFADAWRAGYAPKMKEVRNGTREWTANDILHRERLDEILAEFGVAEHFTEAEKFDFNRVWHRLAPWPDSVPGLSRLKSRYIIGTLSNGSFRLLANMAKHAGLPWDCIVSSDNFHAFKPDEKIYRGAIDLLGGEASRVMLCAAHNFDLAQARKFGMRTAFVHRPTEYGPAQNTDLVPTDDWDIIADSIEEVAERLDV